MTNQVPERLPLRARGPDGEFDLSSYCPHFQHALELLGRRWTGVVLLAMHSGLTRFGQIRRAIPGLSDRLLMERLRELEAEDVVVRSGEGEQTRYSLTKKGEELRPVITVLAEWTQRYCVTGDETVAPIALGLASRVG